MALDSRPSIEPDWEAARTRVATEPWAPQLLTRVEEDFTRWDTLLRIPPPRTRSEWTHHYFCDDGSRLTFDPSAPQRHVCPQCGQTFTGELLDGAWRTQMHNVAASQAQRAVLMMRLSEDHAQQDIARNALIDILEQYAQDYSEYEVHGDKVGRGKVMPQNLDESIWAISLLRAVRWAGFSLPASTRNAAKGLAGQIAALLEPQLGMIHNIDCWIIAALAECGASTGDAALLSRIRSGPHGVEQQIHEGFREEGLWYETSIFYHFYALAALLSYREAAGPDGLSSTDAVKLGRAIAAPTVLAYSDGRLPAYGDCWPSGRLEEFATHVAVAKAVLPECQIDASAYRDRSGTERSIDLWIGSLWQTPGSRPVTGRSSIAALVFGPGPLVDAGEPPTERSFLWPDAGIGALVSDRARITMRFGKDVGMHDHHDKLAVDVDIPGSWSSLDLGSGGYGSAFTRWMRSPAAHNIGSIHDEAQPAVDGVLESCSPTHLTGRVAWGDKWIRRTIRLTDQGWDDTMVLIAGEIGPLQWAFHGDGVVVSDGVEVENAELGDLPGVESYRHIRELISDSEGMIQLTWQIPGAPTMELSLPPGGTAYAAQADGNPTGRPLGVVLVRTHAEETTISVRFTVP